MSKLTNLSRDYSFDDNEVVIKENNEKRMSKRELIEEVRENRQNQKLIVLKMRQLKMQYQKLEDATNIVLKMIDGFPEKAQEEMPEIPEA